MACSVSRRRVEREKRATNPVCSSATLSPPLSPALSLLCYGPGLLFLTVSREEFCLLDLVALLLRSLSLLQQASASVIGM